MDSNLNVVKTYNLYKKAYVHEGVRQPVKESMYWHFCTDRSDLCEENETAETQNILSAEQKVSYQKHLREKKAMRDNRKEYRDNTDIPVLCFDLENVIASPTAENSSFYYKRKLNTFCEVTHVTLKTGIHFMCNSKLFA